MSDLCRLIWCALIGLFQPRAALVAEILALRHQLNVLPWRWYPWPMLVHAVPLIQGRSDELFSPGGLDLAQKNITQTPSRATSLKAANNANVTCVQFRISELVGHVRGCMIMRIAIWCRVGDHHGAITLAPE